MNWRVLWPEHLPFGMLRDNRNTAKLIKSAERGMKILHSAFFIFASLREIFYPEKMNIGTEYIAFIGKEGLLWLRKKNIFQSTVLLSK